MPDRTCSVATCERSTAFRGMCRSHYQADLSAGTECSVDGCLNPVRARGWCTTHHQRWRTTGTVEFAKAPTSCTFPGCSRKYNAKGLCYGHRAQQLRGEELRPLAKRRIHEGDACVIDGCSKVRAARGMCATHDDRVRKHGDPHSDGRLSELDRFFRYVDKNGPVPEHRPDLGHCWLWTAGTGDKGYGNFAHANGTSAHRAAWHLLRGPIPEGLEIDHLCRTPPCVNPDHLEPVDHPENMRRAQPFRKLNRVCLRDHPMSGDNLIIRVVSGRKRRECRRCVQLRERANRRAKREAKRRAESDPLST